MCEFHLNGNCFHPNKVQKGWVANACNVHTCMDCTNTSWQHNTIREQFMYQKELLEMINIPISEKELTMSTTNIFQFFKQ